MKLPFKHFCFPPPALQRRLGGRGRGEIRSSSGGRGEIRSSSAFETHPVRFPINLRIVSTYIHLQNASSCSSSNVVLYILLEGARPPLLEYWGVIASLPPSFSVKCACADGARTAAPIPKSMSLCRLILVVLLCGVRVGQ